MGILQDYLLNDETYEDGLKRALRCWSNDLKTMSNLATKVEELEAELEHWSQHYQMINRQNVRITELEERIEELEGALGYYDPDDIALKNSGNGRKS